MTPIVRVESLSKEFPLPSGERLLAVAEVSFQLNPGEVLGLIGESGSGKSTVGRCLAGLLNVSSGEINWGMENPKVGMVFQEPRASFHGGFQLWEAIADPLFAAGMRRSEEMSRLVAEAANLVGLQGEVLLRNCIEVSDEELQRVSVARALAQRPDILILDEPTTSLDHDARAGVLDVIKDLRSHGEIAILLISHDLLAVKSVTDNVAIMYLGAIAERGPTNRLFSEPVHPYTRALISSALDLDPNSPLSTVNLEGEIPDPINRPSGCPLAPRCPWEIDRCSATVPLEEAVAADHSVACIRWKELV